MMKIEAIKDFLLHFESKNAMRMDDDVGTEVYSMTKHAKVCIHGQGLYQNYLTIPWSDVQ